MYKNTQLHGNAHAYPDVGLCFLLISFVTVSSKMGLYAFYIYECQCFTFVSLSLSDHSLRFDSIIFRFQPQWCTTRATRESHSRYPSFFFHYQLFSNPDFEIPVFNFLLFGCGGDFAGNRGRRTSRRRFWRGKSCRIGLSLTRRSTTTTPSSLCTLIPYRSSSFSVATRFSSRYQI